MRGASLKQANERQTKSVSLRGSTVERVAAAPNARGIKPDVRMFPESTYSASDAAPTIRRDVPTIAKSILSRGVLAVGRSSNQRGCTGLGHTGLLGSTVQCSCYC